MLDSGSGELFAQCAACRRSSWLRRVAEVIPNGAYEHYVERVVDSSRYWVLKIAWAPGLAWGSSRDDVEVNGERHAFIGFGFSDRGFTTPWFGSARQ